MAVRLAVVSKDAQDRLLISWGTLNEIGGVRDTGAPVTLPACSGLTAQLTGNFDTAATVTLQGSNDGVNFAPLRDINNVAIPAITAATALTDMHVIGSRPIFVRPAVTADGAADATAVIVTLAATLDD